MCPSKRCLIKRNAFILAGLNRFSENRFKPEKNAVKLFKPAESDRLLTDHTATYSSSIQVSGSVVCIKAAVFASFNLFCNTYIYIKSFFGFRDLVRNFSCFGPSMRFLELEFSVE